MLEYTKHFDNIRVYEGLAWADFTTDGKLIRKSSDGFFGILDDSQIAEASAKIKTFSPAPFDGNVYLRFNNLPEGGKSKNYATGEQESGVSCYALKWDLVAGAYKITGSGLEGAIIAYTIKGARIYFISGDECGIGSDGEPLLDSPVILADAKYDSKKAGYVIA